MLDLEGCTDKHGAVCEFLVRMIQKYGSAVLAKLDQDKLEGVLEQ